MEWTCVDGVDLEFQTRESDARFRERQQLLKAWLPQAEEFILPGAGHLLHLENPAGMAAGLAAFFARHPISVAA